MSIDGHYLDGVSSKRVPARLDVMRGEAVHIKVVTEQGALEPSVEFRDLKVSSRLGNTPREITFADGQLFISDAHNEIDALINASAARGGWFGASILHRLESNLLMIVLSVGLTGIFAWGLFTYGFPQAARFIAFEMPDYASRKLGSTLVILDKTLFEPSQLDLQRQQKIHDLLDPYLDDYDHLQPKVHFRSGMGANALALPSGDIVFTDEFIDLVKTDEQLLSVFFHELGHLENKHMTRRALQNAMMTLLILFIVGDIESADILVGVPALLAELSYSREFEREADTFAFKAMDANKIPVVSFAEIMQSLSDYYIDEDERSFSLPAYFSTHPPTQERIQRAKAWPINSD